MISIRWFGIREVMFLCVLALRGERAFDNPDGHRDADRGAKPQIKRVDATRPGGTQICGRTVVGEPGDFIGLRRGTEPTDTDRRRGGNDRAIVDLAPRVLAIDHHADRLAAAVDHVDGIAAGQKHHDREHTNQEGAGVALDMFESRHHSPLCVCARSERSHFACRLAERECSTLHGRFRLP